MIIVDDDGPATNPASPINEGFGIGMMKRRVEDLSGKVSVYRPMNEDGFVVRIDIPNVFTNS